MSKIMPVISTLSVLVADTLINNPSKEVYLVNRGTPLPPFIKVGKCGPRVGVSGDNAILTCEINQLAKHLASASYALVVQKGVHRIMHVGEAIGDTVHDTGYTQSQLDTIKSAGPVVREYVDYLETLS